ncbi:MAG TPA: hypothetical protein VGK17_25155, partial [Propionicimonas sp.]
ETAAAATEFPCSAETLDRFVGAVRRRRVAGAAMLGVGGLAVVGLGALGLGQLRSDPVPEVVGPPPATSLASPTGATPAPTDEPSATPSASPTAEPSPSTSPTALPPAVGTPAPGTPTATAPATVTPTTAPPATQPPAVPVPARVTVVDARNGGGSGEIAVTWDTVADATAYRVYRSEAPDGPFVLSAWVDVATGATTVTFTGAHEHISIWPPSAHSFEYIESGTSGGTPVYFRVTALDASGEAPASTVVCGTPTGYPDC